MWVPICMYIFAKKVKYNAWHYFWGAKFSHTTKLKCMLILSNAGVL